MKTIKIYKKALSRKVKNVNKRTKITASSSNENIIKFQNIVTLYNFFVHFYLEQKCTIYTT